MPLIQRGTMPFAARLVIGSLAIAGPHLAPGPALAAQLVSIQGIDLKESEFVAGFDISTEGIKVLALCHLPPGWSFTLSNPAGTTGGITGGGSAGAASLGRENIGELRDLFMIDDLPDKDRSMTGTLSIETRGDAPDMKSRSLSRANFALRNAGGCPHLNERH